MKNVLLTGVSKGLGLQLAETLLQQDYKVYAVSRSTNEHFDNLRALYKEKLIYIPFNLEDTEKIHEVIFKSVLDYQTPLFAYINNAAVAYDDIITNMNYERLNKMFTVNVFSPLMITKYAIRNMLFNNVKGNIVHISSISVHTGYKGLSMYAASKGALEAFSKNTAREWGEKGIRSNCIVAGFMETEMSSKLSDDDRRGFIKETHLKILPIS